MNILSRNIVSAVLLICISIGGCSRSSNPELPSEPTSVTPPGSSPGENWTVQVTVTAHDEFNRVIPLAGPTDIRLTASDRVLHTVIPQGKSSCSFANLPYQRYIATAQQPGYYPSSATSLDIRYDSLAIQIDLFPYLPTLARVDSIQCLLGTDLPLVRLRLFTAQTLPIDGQRSAIIFVGLGSDVSPRYGTYVLTVNWAAQAPGTSQIFVDDFYRQLHHLGVATGTRVYVTARLTSGATTSYQDNAAGLLIFSNLEENTHVVASFIMP